MSEVLALRRPKSGMIAQLKDGADMPYYRCHKTEPDGYCVQFIDGVIKRREVSYRDIRVKKPDGKTVTARKVATHTLFFKDRWGWCGIFHTPKDGMFIEHFIDKYRIRNTCLTYGVDYIKEIDPEDFLDQYPQLYDEINWSYERYSELNAREIRSIKFHHKMQNPSE